MSDRNRQALQRQFRSGFTLVELLTVIGIIALLISILVPTIARSRRQAFRVQTGMDLNTITQALEAYRQQTGNYPTVTGTQDGSAGMFSTLAQPFTLRQGGISYGPFIDPQKFNTAGSQLND